MAVCRAYRLPLSEFLSWSQADQDAALAYEAWQGKRCQSCGLHPDDDSGDLVVLNVFCRGCEVTAAHSKVNPHLAEDRAISFSVTPRR